MKLIEELKVRGVTKKVSIPCFDFDLPELPFTAWTHGCCFCYNLK